MVTHKAEEEIESLNLANQSAPRFLFLKVCWMAIVVQELRYILFIYKWVRPPKESELHPSKRLDERLVMLFNDN